MRCQPEVLLLTIAASLLALGGCAMSGPVGSGKPVGDKADDAALLCTSAGEAPDCDICAVEGWYGDGECDDFCGEPDPDCEGEGGPLPMAVCDAGTRFPLGRATGDLGYAIAASEVYTVDDVASLEAGLEERLRVTLTHHNLMGTAGDIESGFGFAAEGSIAQITLARDDHSYHWIQLYADSKEVGAIFDAGTALMVGEVSDGHIIGCVAPSAGPAAPDAIADVVYCSADTELAFVGDGVDLLDYIVDSVTYTRSLAVPEHHAAYIIATANHISPRLVARDAALDAAYAWADGGSFRVHTIEAPAGDYVLVDALLDDDQVGAVFEEGSLFVNAELRDGALLGCEAYGP